jgi:hypothetical protein
MARSQSTALAIGRSSFTRRPHYASLRNTKSLSSRAICRLVGRHVIISDQGFLLFILNLPDDSLSYPKLEEVRGC